MRTGGFAGALPAIWQRGALQTGGLEMPCTCYGRELPCTCYGREYARGGLREYANGGLRRSLACHMAERWLANGGLRAALHVLWQRAALHVL
jgi:hypothetical protein